MDTLLHFLADLAISPGKQESYSQNPIKTVETAGLSEAGQTSLMRRDRKTVIAYFENELRVRDLTAVVGTCCVLDPGPDPTPDPDPGPDDDPESASLSALLG